MSQEPSTTTGRHERVLGSFASLLSSALTANGETPELLSTSSSNLPRFISSTVSDDTDCCTVPCLMLKHSDSSSTQRTPSSLEETAALYLARPLTLTRAELEEVPIALLGNISDSFLSLVDSRLRSSLAALMRNTDAHQESAITRTVVGLLASSEKPIFPTAVVTSFRALPGCDRTQNGGHVAPLIMETVIDLSIMSQLVTVTFVVPGTIQGSFDSSCSACLLTKVEVVLDTVSLLQSMMNQARSAVREAVIIASGVASNILVDPPDGNGTSTAAEEDTHIQVQSQPSLTSENREEPPTYLKTEKEQGAPNMRLPTARQPPSRGGSTPDLPFEDQVESSDPQSKASWQIPKGNGLSLLTAAVIGLKQPVGPVPKRRRNGNSPPPRKVSSCPWL